MVTFHPSAFFLEEEEELEPIELAEDQYIGYFAGQVTGQDKILAYCVRPRTAKEIMALVGLKHRESFYNNYLKPLMQKGLIAMTIPDKPQSRMQQYVSKKGRRHDRQQI